jgi:thiamine biosynthesis protein ThiI
VKYDYWQLFSDPSALDRQLTHVLYCDSGLLTAQLAEKLQRLGYEAYSFKGGARRLRQYADAEGLQPA